MNYLGRQTLVLDKASKGSPIAQVSYMDGPNDVSYITPYGFYSSPPVNSCWVVFPLRDNDNDMVGFGNDYVNRPKDLKPSDVCLMNTLSKVKFVLKTNGDFDLYAPESINFNCKKFNIVATEEVNITSPLTNITSDLTVIGTIIGDIIKSLGELFWNGIKAVSTHTHGAGPPPN